MSHEVAVSLFRTQYSRQLGPYQRKKHSGQYCGYLNCPFENRYWMDPATDTRLSLLPLLYTA
jgi:hypothetical protein